MNCCGGGGGSGAGHAGHGNESGAGSADGQQQKFGGITWVQALALLLIVGFILSLLMR